MNKNEKLDYALKIIRLKSAALNMPKLDNATVLSIRMQFQREYFCTLKEIAKDDPSICLYSC